MGMKRKYEYYLSIEFYFGKANYLLLLITLFSVNFYFAVANAPIAHIMRSATAIVLCSTLVLIGLMESNIFVSAIC